MASRIFPTKQNDNLDRSSVIHTIGTEQLSSEMNKLSGIKSEMMKTASSKDKKEDRTKKRYKTEPSVCPECGVEHPCSCDVVAAETAGDHKAVAAMMEARANRRMAHMQTIEAASAEEELEIRTAFRAGLLDELTSFAGSIAGPGIPDGTGPWGGTDKCPMNKLKKDKKDKKDRDDDDDDDDKDDKNDEKESCSLSSLSAAQKAYFARYADAIGWPAEYVEAVTAAPIKVASIPEATKMVLANKQIEKNNKRQLIVAMHKEAKLSPEQANRIKTYWSQELGYPDTEWIGDLVEEPSGK